MTLGTTTVHLQTCLNRLRAGEVAARAELLLYSQDRLRKLTAKMLGQFPAVHRWEETDDVLQRVLLRVDHLLGQVEVVAVRDYLCLAATNLRRVLIDLIRHYQGRNGLGANHATPPPGQAGEPAGLASLAAGTDSSAGPLSLDDWSAFHTTVAELPEDERAVFDLLWYHEVTQQEAAEVLGISLSTLKRRWQSARLLLTEALGGRGSEGPAPR